MAKDTKNAVTIDGVEYYVDDFSDSAKAIFDHVVDLDRKVKGAHFNLIQLQVGLDSFIARLKAELPSVEPADSTEAAVVGEG